MAAGGATAPAATTTASETSAIGSHGVSPDGSWWDAGVPYDE